MCWCLPSEDRSSLHYRTQLLYRCAFYDQMIMSLINVWYKTKKDWENTFLMHSIFYYENHSTSNAMPKLYSLSTYLIIYCCPCISYVQYKIQVKSCWGLSHLVAQLYKSSSKKLLTKDLALINKKVLYFFLSKMKKKVISIKI